MNPADESSWKSDYMQTEQNKRCHKNDSMSISSEKHHESSFKQFQSIFTQNNNSSSISVKNKSAWQINNLISIFINKLITVMLEADEQYNYHIRETDFKMKCLIQMLSLQATT